MFFPSEKELFSWTYLQKKKTPPRTKVLISSVWNKILKTWETLSELIEIQVQCIKNYFKFFYHKKLELLEITYNIEKESQMLRPKLKKYVYYIFAENICSACNPMQVVVFCKKCISFIKQRLKFSHYEGNIVPYSIYNKVFIIPIGIF